MSAPVGITRSPNIQCHSRWLAAILTLLAVIVFCFNTRTHSAYVLVQLLDVLNIYCYSHWKYALANHRVPVTIFWCVTAVHLYNCAYYRVNFNDATADSWLLWIQLLRTWGIFA